MLSSILQPLLAWKNVAKEQITIKMMDQII